MGAFGSCWIQLHLDLPVQNPIHLLKRKVQGVLPRGEADPRRMRLVCMFRNVSSVIFICVSELLVEAGADLGLAAWCDGTSPWHWHKVRSKLGGTSSAVWSPSKACCRQHEDTRAQGTHFLQVNTPGEKKKKANAVSGGDVFHLRLEDGVTNGTSCYMSTSPALPTLLWASFYSLVQGILICPSAWK